LLHQVFQSVSLFFSIFIALAAPHYGDRKQICAVCLPRANAA
jgi:hypothetical protein